MNVYVADENLDRNLVIALRDAEVQVISIFEDYRGVSDPEVIRIANENNAVILVTHYQRLLDYIVPDFVHVLYKGKIVKSGDKNLALELEERGYDWIIKEQPQVA